MFRRRAAILMLIFMTPLLFGCMPGRHDPEEASGLALPEPSDEPENMILGEWLPVQHSNISLYYAISDGATFSQVTRSISPDAGQSTPEAAVQALLNPTHGEEAVFSTGNTKMLSCEYACGLATVNLSIDARDVESEQSELALLTAIGNTLLSIEGVKGVNVLVGSQAERFDGLPMGVQTEKIPSAAGAYAQIQAERDHLKTDDPLPLTRTVALYFPTSEGNWLIPELQQITFETDNFVETLLEAMKAGPQIEACAVASIPAGVELMDDRPSVQTTDAGEHVLTLNFTSTLANYLVLSGLDVWELVGSLTLTTCSFLPEVDAVRIMVDGEVITSCQVGERLLRFEDGLIRRGDFASYVGSVAALCLAADDGTLQIVRRSVSTRSALSPKNLLDELFFYADRGRTLTFPVPDHVFADDILGIQLSGQIAQVNLSANFYRCCQALNEVQERSLIYCIVNTLCAMEDIRAVRFYVEGVSAQTLAGHIYLKSPLMYNPGIIVEPDEVEEP